MRSSRFSERLTMTRMRWSIQAFSTVRRLYRRTMPCSSRKCICTLLVTCRLVYFKSAGMICSPATPEARPMVMRTWPSEDSSFSVVTPPTSPASTASASMPTNFSVEPSMVSA